MKRAWAFFKNSKFETFKQCLKESWRLYKINHYSKDLSKMVPVLMARRFVDMLTFVNKIETAEQTWFIRKNKARIRKMESEDRDFIFDGNMVLGDLINERKRYTATIKTPKLLIKE